MRVVLLDGSPPADVFTSGVRDVVIELLEKRGAQTRVLTLEALGIAACIGCFDCWTRMPGRCRFRDDGEVVEREMVDADVAVLLGPVTFGGYAPALKRAVDRMLPMLSPFLANQDGETYRRARYDNFPVLVGLGTMEEPDAESVRVFRNVVERNALHLHAPGYVAGIVHHSLERGAARASIDALLARAFEQGLVARPYAKGVVMAVRK